MICDGLENAPIFSSRMICKYYIPLETSEFSLSYHMGKDIIGQ